MKKLTAKQQIKKLIKKTAQATPALQLGALRIMEIPLINRLQFKHVEYRRSMGKIYAFVTCTDLGMDGKGTFEKNYWGEVLEHNNPDQITEVIKYGGKWDNLP